MKNVISLEHTGHVRGWFCPVPLPFDDAAYEEINYELGELVRIGREIIGGDEGLTMAAVSRFELLKRGAL